jgi:IS5 family transposase
LLRTPLKTTICYNFANKIDICKRSSCCKQVFFELTHRHQELNERDPLIALNKWIELEGFIETLQLVRRKKRKNKSGRKPFDEVLMFKALVLQHCYNLSDDDLEYQIRDCYSFCRFLGPSPERKVPDAKTIWLFREQLVQLDLMKILFNDFPLQLEEQGYTAKKGQIVDASFVDIPKQRNTREENQQIKSG